MVESQFQLHPCIDLVKTGKNLKDLLQQKHVKVAQLSDALNLSDPRAIYFWLQGKKLPSIDNLLALSVYFKVSINDILWYSFNEPVIIPYDDRAA